MVAVQPTPLAARIWWIHTAKGIVGLAHTFSEATVEQLNKFIQLKQKLSYSIDFYIYSNLDLSADDNVIRDPCKDWVKLDLGNIIV